MIMGNLSLENFIPEWGQVAELTHTCYLWPMKKIIPLLIILSASLSWSQGVEFEIPMFSKKVREQGVKEKPKTENCTVDSVSQQNGNASVSCGTSKPEEFKKPNLGELGADNSQMAQDKVRQHQNKTR